MSYIRTDDPMLSGYMSENWDRDRDSYDAHKARCDIYEYRSREHAEWFLKWFNDTDKAAIHGQWCKSSGRLHFPDKEMKVKQFVPTEINLFAAFDFALTRSDVIAAGIWLRPDILGGMIGARLVEMTFAMGIYRPSVIKCSKTFSMWFCSRLKSDSFLNKIDEMKLRYIENETSLSVAEAEADEAIKRAAARAGRSE
jgi:hypothetical protein